jgi:hypothetical protein
LGAIAGCPQGKYFRVGLASLGMKTFPDNVAIAHHHRAH